MNVLFVCVGNSCRSQMAEGLAKAMGLTAASAGTHPAAKVAAHALTLLESRGIDTTGMRPQSIDEFQPKRFDKVISMGCGVHCPATKTGALKTRSALITRSTSARPRKSSVG